MKKFALLMTVVASLLTFNANASEGAAPAYTTDAAEAMTDLDMHFVGSDLYIGEVVLVVGQKATVTLLSGVKIIIRNTGRGLIYIARKGFEGAKWILRTTVEGAVYLVKAAFKITRWVVTKTVEGVVGLAKFVGKTLYHVGHFALEVGEFVFVAAATAVILPFYILHEVLAAIEEHHAY